MLKRLYQEIVKGRLLALGGAMLLAGCGALPGQGPLSMDVTLKDKAAPLLGREYTIIPLDSQASRRLGAQLDATLSDAFSGTINGNTGMVLGVGDRLVINIWEAAADGLFSTVEEKQTQIQAEVDENGQIYIPYVGQLRVSGKSIEQVRKTIESGLRGKAVEPQVQVALTNNISSNVVIVGDVAQPGQYPLPVGGLRLMEAIAQAGGATQPVFKTEVTIVRGNVTGTVRLDEVLRRQNNNVWLQPRDTVQVLAKPRTFTAFGAVSKNNHLEFKTERVSLAEALAQSGGLSDYRADAGGVFLFRFEQPSRLQDAGFPIPEQLFEGRVATIYSLDFKEPQAFLNARSFMMKDKDIIYVANAPLAEFRKFISIVVAPITLMGRSISDFSE
jgi:polysaccharide export outer membrane protein